MASKHSAAELPIKVLRIIEEKEMEMMTYEIGEKIFQEGKENGTGRGKEEDITVEESVKEET